MLAITKRLLVWLSASEVKRYGTAVGVNIATIAAQVLLVLLSGGLVTLLSNTEYYSLTSIKAQIILSWQSGSLALLSDTIHLGSDSITAIGSLVVALLVLAVSKEAGVSIRKWFGYAGIILLWIGAYHIQQEAYERMLHPTHIGNIWVLAGGIIGALGNLFVLFVLKGVEHGRPNHTHKILSWHVFFDLLFSFVVIISAISSMWFSVDGVDTWISHKLSFFMVGLGGFLFAEIMRGHNHSH